MQVIKYTWCKKVHFDAVIDPEFPSDSQFQPFLISIVHVHSVWVHSFEGIKHHTTAWVYDTAFSSILHSMFKKY